MGQPTRQISHRGRRECGWLEGWVFVEPDAITARGTLTQQPHLESLCYLGAGSSNASCRSGI